MKKIILLTLGLVVVFLNCNIFENKKIIINYYDFYSHKPIKNVNSYTNKYVREYKKNNHTMKKEFFKKQRLYYCFKYQYNENGQIQEIAFYNDKGRLVENSFGVAVFKFKYNKNGKLQERTYLNKDRTYNESVAKSIIEYDDLERVQKIVFYDKNNKLVNAWLDLLFDEGTFFDSSRSIKISIREYEYDKNNKISKFIEYNSNKKILYIRVSDKNGKLMKLIK